MKGYQNTGNHYVYYASCNILALVQKTRNNTSHCIISQYTYDTGIVLIPLLFVLSKDRFGTGKTL